MTRIPLYLIAVLSLFIDSRCFAEDYSNDLQRILESSEKIVQEELRKNELLLNANEKSSFLSLEEMDEEGGLLVFISSSVPVESWQAHSKVLEKIGGSFVLRGMPQNSLKEFIKYVQRLKKSGIEASIKVDSTGFEKYQIKSVPAIVLETSEGFDKSTGNILIREALGLFSRKGSTREKAKKLLRELDNSWEVR